MQTLNHLLVVLGDDPDEARYILEKAAVLAGGSGASVHVVRVVYEGIADLSAGTIDGAVDLKSFILQAEETATEDMVEGIRSKVADLDCVTLWNARAWEGILHAAVQVRADLIVKGVSRHPRFGEIVRTPDDWNLLRVSEVPVMLVKPQAWVSEPVILCALDPFDEAHDPLNLALLRKADALTRVLAGELHVVAAYPLSEQWVGELGGIRDYETLKKDIEEEIRQRIGGLSTKAGVDHRRLYAEEGRPEFVIARLAEDLDAELVVVGTHARQGLKGLVLGNTSERLVHHLHTDLVTVHA